MKQLHLRLVRGDDETHCSELAWYYNHADHYAGLKSVQLPTDAPRTEMIRLEGNGYTDEQLDAFGRVRRVWRTLQLVPWTHQQTLREWYEPRQWYPDGYKRVEEVSVKRAHASYYEARAHLRVVR